MDSRPQSLCSLKELLQARWSSARLIWATLFAASALGGITPVAAHGQIVVRAGATASAYTEPDGFASPPDERRRGLSVGISLALPVRGWLEVVPEASWVPRGATGTDEQSGIRQRHRAELGYLDFAVLARAFVGSQQSIRAYAAAGPVLSFLTTCAVETEFTFVFGDSTTTRPSLCDRPLFRFTESPVDDVDLGFALTVGVDVDLPIVSGFLNVEGRFVRGFQSAFEDDRRFPLKNTLYGVTVGYGFDVW